MINGNVVRAPVACTVSVPVRCHIEAGADSRLLHNVTSSTGSPVIEPEQLPNLVRVFIWRFSTGEVARLPVMRGIDLGRGLVKRLARQRRFEPPSS
jgi:hypothetical protein